MERYFQLILLFGAHVAGKLGKGVKLEICNVEITVLTS